MKQALEHHILAGHESAESGGCRHHGITWPTIWGAARSAAVKLWRRSGADIHEMRPQPMANAFLEHFESDFTATAVDEHVAR